MREHLFFVGLTIPIIYNLGEIGTKIPCIEMNDCVQDIRI